MHVLIHSVLPTQQQATTDPCLWGTSLDTLREVWVNLLWGHWSFSWVLVLTSFYLCPQRVYFPFLRKFWQLCGGVNGNFFQEGLCHTEVCCTPSPCPCSSPWLTHTSKGDVQTQFCLSLCGVSGSWCAQGLFEHFESLWQKWCLILNVTMPLLPSFWLLLCPWMRVSPHNCSSTYHLPGVSLTLHVGYLLMAAPVPHSHCTQTTLNSPMFAL